MDDVAREDLCLVKDDVSVQLVDDVRVRAGVRLGLVSPIVIAVHGTADTYERGSDEELKAGEVGRLGCGGGVAGVAEGILGGWAGLDAAAVGGAAADILRFR